MYLETRSLTALFNSWNVIASTPTRATIIAALETDFVVPAAVADADANATFGSRGDRASELFLAASGAIRGKSKSAGAAEPPFGAV